MLGAAFAWEVIRLVFALFLVLCSRSFSGELFMNQHEVSKDLHQKLSEMRIVETPLHSVRSVAQDGTRVLKLARHDFLLLRTVGDKWYKAEKHGPSSGQAGIHFYPVTGPGAETIRFRSSISVDFSLAQALAILTDHKLDYSLWGENCWKYAHARAEAILNSCIEIASDDNVRNELKKELENLMDARRRMPNEVVDIVQDYNVLRGSLFWFTLVFFYFLLGFCKNLVRGPLIYYKLGVLCSSFFGFFFMHDPTSIFLTYNLKELATTYSWSCRFLCFFCHYVGLIVFERGMISCFLKLKKYNSDKDPFLRTGRGDVDIAISSANYHQDNSVEDQRIEWPPRTLFFGFFILDFMTVLEPELGCSYALVHLCCSLVWMASKELRALTRFPPH